MYRNTKKGFTIVELVIVIAVIAILAGVLIPTFSSLVQKANLSSDKQAVRQMNLALQNDEALNGKCTTIEQAMQVIANAGYDSDKNWTCLTDGYLVYWYKADNRCLLYNSTTGKVEYPTEYDISDVMSRPDEFFVYNQTFKNAFNTDLTLGSSSATSTSGEALTSGSSNQTVQLGSQSVTVSGNVLGALDSMNLGGKNIYGYNKSESSFGSATATLESMVIGSSSSVTPNVYYISVSSADGATAEDKLEAQKAAGNTVYSIFVQMNAGTIANDVNVVLAPGTEINVSDREWQPAKLFKGYFGTTDASNPIVINGMELSSATSYINTYTFEGSASTYYLTGFFGAITNDAGEKTVVENLSFKNVNIVKPAGTEVAIANPSANDSNCTAIFGGIVSTRSNSVLDVTLRNIKVEDSSVHGTSRVGGLVAYIGGFQSGSDKIGVQGKVVIENCNVEMDVKTDRTTAYGTCGGIVGFINKNFNAGAFEVTIENCTFTGKLDGVHCGGIVGAFVPQVNPSVATLNIVGCTSNATKVANASNKRFGQLIGTIDAISNYVVTKIDGTVITAVEEGNQNIGGVKY